MDGDVGFCCCLISSGLYDLREPRGQLVFLGFGAKLVCAAFNDLERHRSVDLKSLPISELFCPASPFPPAEATNEQPEKNNQCTREVRPPRISNHKQVVVNSRNEGVLISPPKNKRRTTLPRPASKRADLFLAHLFKQVATNMCPGECRRKLNHASNSQQADGL